MSRNADIEDLWTMDPDLVAGLVQWTIREATRQHNPEILTTLLDNVLSVLQANARTGMPQSVTDLLATLIVEQTEV